MAYKSYRVNVNTAKDEEIVHVNLKQGIDTLKILSLELNTDDAYQLHTSDYGVIIGRILANNSYGVPNTKVSVFIALDDEDSEDSEKSYVYPYATMQTKNNDGQRYNLLPDSSFNGYDGNYKPIGSFPNKRKVLDNDIEEEIFDKYLKYTTVTNEYGDYMIFGVPTGATQVHINCDLSDIGLLSQRPYDFVAKGYNTSLFKSMTEFKTDNLDSAPQVITQDKTVTVFPFWGDSDENRIGITRCDIDLNYEFTPCCVFMGSCITDATGSYFGVNGIPNGSCGRFDALNTSTGNIEIIRKTENGTIESVTENVNGIIDGNGVWCYQIPMNLDKIGMDEEGNIIPINTPGQGISTRARVRMRVSLTSADDASTAQYTGKMLIPCNPPLKGANSHPSLNYDDNFTTEDWDNYFEFGAKTPDCCFRDLYWNKVYSVKCFYPRIQNGPTDPYGTSFTDPDWVDYSQMPVQYSKPLSCISFISDDNGKNTFPYNTMYSGAENANDKITFYWFMKHLVETSTSTFAEKGLHFCFENDWINGCLYFPRVLIKLDQSGNVDYFGGKNDKEDEETYTNMYLTGRHELLYNGGFYKTHRDWNDRWTRTEDTNVTIDKTSRFSQVRLPIGIIKKVENSIGASVYYYRCGGCVGKNYYRLYSSDIILLGNLIDVTDNLPKVYNKLPSTTALFPPMSPPKELDESGMNMNGYRKQLNDMFHDSDGLNGDSERIDIYGNAYKVIEGEARTAATYVNLSNLRKYQEYGEFSNALWEDAKKSCPSTENGEIMFYAQERLALFFAYRVGLVQDYLHYFPHTFVNTSRICELDVQNDHAIRGSLLYQDFVFPINGIIDRFDISNNDTRSEFASLNYDITKYTIDAKTHQRKFVPTPLYMVDFDGRLNGYINKRSFNYVDEEQDESYILFRYGDSGNGPMKYPKTLVTDTWGLNEDMIIPQNSFYFYFGLNSGFSAIDLLYKNYCAKATSNTTAVNSDDALDVNIYNSNACDEDGTTTSYAEITAAHTLVPPFAYYLYKNNNLIGKGVNYTNTISISGLSDAFYSIEVNDCQNHTSTASFEVKAERLNISYANSNEDDYTIIINSIESSDINIDNYGTKITGNNFTVETKDGNKYNVRTSTKCSVIGEKNSLTVFGGQYENHYLKFTFTASTKVTFTITDSNNPCHSVSFSTYPTANKDVTFYVNNVPIDVLVRWEDDLDFNYLHPLEIVDNNTSDYNYSVYRMSAYTPTQQLQFVGNILNGLYGGNIKLTHSGGSDKVKDLCISPFTNTSVQSSSGIYGILLNGLINIETSHFFSINGYCNNNSILPSLVGVNYPQDTEMYVPFKRPIIYDDNTDKAFYNTYWENDNLKTTNNPNIVATWGRYWGKAVYTDECYNKTGILCNYNYLGFAYNETKSSPEYIGLEEDSKKLINAEHSFLGGFDNCVTKNFFEFPTADRRLDYQFIVDTPVILPSGYDNFSNLATKSLHNGSYKIITYGGLMLKYSGDTTDNLKLMEYDWSDKYNSYITNTSYPNENRNHFQSIIYEDDNYSGTTETKYCSIKRNYDRKTYHKDWKQQCEHTFYCDENLIGNNKLSFQLTDCSCDFSDGYVHAGNTMNIDVSYKPGIRPYHPTSIGDGTYDIVYEQSTESHIYCAKLVANDEDADKIKKISGFTEHTQTHQFFMKIYPDNEYAGDTCTYITFDTNEHKSLPNWMKQYTGNLAVKDGDGTDYSNRLLVRRIPNSKFTTISTCYSCNTNTIDQTVLSDLALNWDRYCTPWYNQTNGSLGVCYDTDANQYITFKEDDANDKTDVFDKYDSILLSCEKVYVEPSKSGLLHQGFVHNQGYAYYASYITVTAHYGEGHLLVSLYSPLKDSSGKVDYSTTKLCNSKGMYHTVGEISNYSCPNHTVTYDKSTLTFTITLNGEEPNESILPLYFEIENGLRYAVNIHIS